MLRISIGKRKSSPNLRQLELVCLPCLFLFITTLGIQSSSSFWAYSISLNSPACVMKILLLCSALLINSTINDERLACSRSFWFKGNWINLFMSVIAGLHCEGKILFVVWIKFDSLRSRQVWQIRAESDSRSKLYHCCFSELCWWCLRPWFTVISRNVSDSTIQEFC